jgi:hypothetical protein
MQHWSSLSTRINKSRFGGDWKKLDFVFDQTDHALTIVPDLCIAYISGIVIFRSQLREALFPFISPRMEFLPISVERADWILLNCLETSRSYIGSSSVFMRGLDSQICFTQHLEFAADQTPEADLFTLEDSNRAELFCLEAFKERIEQHSLSGIEFGQVGLVVGR